jgi:SNF family Na+-dependent transporter
MILEFALGQTIQRGDITVWSKLSPRLAGIGYASVYAAYGIDFYYNVIIAWALVYFFSAFRNPLPWSVQETTNDAGTYKDCPQYYITEEYFYKDLLHVYNDDCTKYDTFTQMGGHTTFQWQIWLCMMCVWACDFFAVFKGVKGSSWVVWITVPLPIVFVFIMVLNGLTLDNCDKGFKMYLKGTDPVTGEEPDLNKKLQNPSMWSEACAQIFFSLGVCMGIMIPYSSYLPQDAPIIKNAFTVALCNCSFSFFAGFGVFSIVGYLVGMGSPVAENVSSIGLAFIAYPAALDTLPGANFWALMFALTLFTLGIDSSFSIVEGVCTILADT